MNVSIPSSSDTSGANYRGGPWFGSKLNAQRRSSFGLTDICLINSEEQEEKASDHPRLQASVGPHGGTGRHIFPRCASTQLTPYLLLMRWRVKGIWMGDSRSDIWRWLDTLVRHSWSVWPGSSFISQHWMALQIFTHKEVNKAFMDIIALGSRSKHYWFFGSVLK